METAGVATTTAPTPPARVATAQSPAPELLELRKTAELLRELIQMKAEGLIDEAEFQQMRKAELSKSVASQGSGAPRGGDRESASLGSIRRVSMEASVEGASSDAPLDQSGQDVEPVSTCFAFDPAPQLDEAERQFQKKLLAAARWSSAASSPSARQLQRQRAVNRREYELRRLQADLSRRKAQAEYLREHVVKRQSVLKPISISNPGFEPEPEPEPSLRMGSHESLLPSQVDQSCLQPQREYVQGTFTGHEFPRRLLETHGALPAQAEAPGHSISESVPPTTGPLAAQRQQAMKTALLRNGLETTAGYSQREGFCIQMSETPLLSNTTARLTGQPELQNTAVAADEDADVGLLSVGQPDQRENPILVGPLNFKQRPFHSLPPKPAMLAPEALETETTVATVSLATATMGSPRAADTAEDIVEEAVPGEGRIARTEWERIADQDGSLYFAHVVTGETSWEAPPEVVAAEVGAAAVVAEQQGT